MKNCHDVQHFTRQISEHLFVNDGAGKSVIKQVALYMRLLLPLKNNITKKNTLFLGLITIFAVIDLKIKTKGSQEVIKRNIHYTTCTTEKLETNSKSNKNVK